MTYTVTITEPGAEPVSVSLEWTTDVPTEPGWYWAYAAPNENNPDGLTTCVQVWRSMSGELVVLAIMARLAETLDDYARWLGPIPMPPKGEL